jgi:tRNA (guanine-N7-)-methyltransferase
MCSEMVRHKSETHFRNFYGRFKGKRLSTAQLDSLLTEFKKYSLKNISWEENPQRNKISLSEIFDEKSVWLEIGFGGGEHLVHQAKLNPDIGFIGCEPYQNGVAKLMGKLITNPCENIKLYDGDVRNIFDVLAKNSISKVFLLYPDPWPKKRHHRRRFVTQEFLDPLYKSMKPGSILRIATDIEDYVRQALQEAPRAGFQWLAKDASDWRNPWQDWVSTRYEIKALKEKRTPHYLTFIA